MTLPPEDRDLIERVLGYDADENVKTLLLTRSDLSNLLAVARAEAVPVVDDAELLGQARGALNFILAFYEPGQRYLDTNAWKQAELSGKLALIALSRRLGVPVSAWVERSVPKAALEAALTQPNGGQNDQ